MKQAAGLRACLLDDEEVLAEPQELAKKSSAGRPDMTWYLWERLKMPMDGQSLVSVVAKSRIIRSKLSYQLSLNSSHFIF